MFSSPAPQARRRLGSRQPVSVSASLRSTPLLASTPLRDVDEPARSFYSVGQSQDGMDVDLDDASPVQNRVLMKDDDYSVVMAGHLPVELRDILQKTNLESELFHGFLDTQTGYGCLLSIHHCFVWNYASPSSSQAPYEFPLPATQSNSLPCAAIVPHNSREPGVLVCSAEGEARYWDSVARALTSSRKFSRLLVPLEDGEKISGIWRWDPAVYLITTTYSRIYRITLTTTHAGLQLLLSSPFARQRGVLHRVTSGWFGPGSALSNDDDHAIVGLAVSHDVDNGKDVWVAKARNVEQWRLDRDGGEQLVLDQPLQELLASALANSSQSGDAYNLRLLDIAVLEDTCPAVLFSFVRASAVKPSTSAGQMTYSYAIAKLQTSGGGLKPSFVRELTYTTLAKQPVMAYLAVPPGDTVAFVQFPDAVVVTTLLLGSLLHEVIPLRNPVQNRYLGFGVHAEEGRVTFITARSGLLAFEVDVHGLKQKAIRLLQSGDREEAATARLKDKVEHAVFFGVSQDNPLSFDFNSDSLEGNLAAAVEQVCAEIMTSSSKHMQETLDMRQQLYDRLARLENLINFVNANNLRAQLSMDTRWSLCTDAEKIAAAIELWTLQSSLLHQVHGPASRTIVAQVIESYMLKANEPLRDDNVRQFLKAKTSAIGRIIDELEDIVRRALSSSDTLNTAAIISTANRIIQAVLISALVYRETWAETCGLREIPASETPPLWTTAGNHADVVVALMQSTARVYQELDTVMTHETKRGVTHEHIDGLRLRLRDELTFLTRLYFGMIRELQQVRPENAAQRANVERASDVYNRHRSDFISYLVKVGKAEEAIQLAEQERDWRTLVVLSNDASIGHPARIEDYIHRHGEDFAFPLYQWYIETGKLYELLKPYPSDEDLLDSFFARNRYPRLSWIQHLSRGRTPLAARSLELAAAEETRAEEKLTILSIGKLCDLAGFQYEDLQNEGVVKVLEAYDAAIEFIDAHSHLQHELLDLVASSRTSNVDALVDAITPAVTRRLRSPALVHLFRRSAKRLFEGRVLSPEDLIDMETLMDNTRTPMNYSVALKIFSRMAKGLPSARATTTLQTIWRRAFLWDNWAEFNLNDRTDDVIVKRLLRGTALYRTLRSAWQDEIPQRYWLRPSQCLQPATRGEYVAHWGDYGLTEIEELERGHADEIDRLARLISPASGVGLERWYDEVLRIREDDKKLEAEGHELGEPTAM